MWQTVEQLASELGTVPARILNSVRTGEPFQGHTFEADKTKKPPLFRVLGSNGSKEEVSSNGSKEEPAPKAPELLESALKANEEQALEGAGVALEKLPEYLAGLTRPMALRKLQELSGIGPVGAARVCDYAKTLGWVPLEQPVPEMPYEVPEPPEFVEAFEASDLDMEDGQVLQEGVPLPIKRTILPHAQRHHPMLSGCVAVGRAEHGSEAWMLLRAKGIGSSDAGAVLGLSPYATAHDVWATKVGVETKHKPWMEPYAWFGTFFEPFVLFKLGLTSGAELGTLRSETWSFAMANIDGLHEEDLCIEEIKTSSEKWDTVPPAYFAQVQHQMAVTGLDVARIRQFICPVPREHLRALIDRVAKITFTQEEAERLVCEWLWEVGELVTWVVEYDAGYVAQLMERGRELWGYCESGEEPPEQTPLGELDLSENGKLSAALTAYADMLRRVDSEAVKAADKLKKEARLALEEAVALHKDTPKKVVCGPHNATFVNRHGGYWQIRGGDDGIDF